MCLSVRGVDLGTPQGGWIGHLYRTETSEGGVTEANPRTKVRSILRRID